MRLARTVATMLAFAGVWASVAGPAATATAAPMRIVSANLCADRLVLRLAPRAHVLSVSALATDPMLSTVARDAAGLAVNRGDAEEILALRPDLVVVGPYDRRGAAGLLRRLGIAVHDVPLAADLDGARAAIRDLAALLAAGPRGEALIAAMDARLAGLPRPPAGWRVLSIHAGGWIAGAGTPAAAILASIGAQNAAEGISGYRRLDVEEVLVRAPDLIVVERAGGDGTSIAGESMRHPALERAAWRRVDIPARDWACPDDALAGAAAVIAEASR